MTATVTGKDAEITIQTKLGTVYGLSDFSISFSRGTSEQPLIGCEGNEFFEGAITINGSYTCCKFAADQNCDALKSIVEGSVIRIIGKIGTSNGDKFINWDFTQCQVTSYGVSIGNASKISEASIDFVIMNPYLVQYNNATGEVSC